MKRRDNSWLQIVGLTILVTVVASLPASAQMGKGSAEFTAEHLLKIMELNSTLNNAGKSISVYVMDDPGLAGVLRGMVGRGIGDATLGNVGAGSSVPSSPVDVIYIGNPDSYLTNSAGLNAIITYARGNGVLSVTYEAILIYKGISLAVGEEGGGAAYVINLEASKQEGQKWKRAALKVAETI